MEEDGLRRKATQSIAWVVLERWSTRLISLAVLIVLTRVLTPEEFGLISLATAFIALTQVFVDSGFSRALIQRKTLAPKDASTAFWTSLCLAVILTAATLALAPIIAASLGVPALAPVLQALSFVLPVTALSQTPAALLERDFDFKSLSVRQFVGTISGAAIAVPLAVLGAGVWSLVAQVLVSAAVSVVVLWASTPWRPRLEYSRQSVKDLAAVGSTVLGIDLLDAVQANIDKIVIGALFSASDLGYYFLAQRVGTVLIELVTSVISRVSFTTFSRVQDDPIRLNRIFRQLTFAASAASVPIFGLVALLAPQLIGGIFGAEWLPAVPFIWILAAGWALGAVMYFDRTVLLATKHAGAALGLAIFQNAVGVLLVFALAPLGVFGVAFSRLSKVLTWPARLVVLRKVAGIHVWAFMLQTVRCVVAISPVLVAIGLLQSTSWASTGASLWTFAVPLGLAGMVVYAFALWGLAGKENRSVLRTIMRELKDRLRR